MLTFYSKWITKFVEVSRYLDREKVCNCLLPLSNSLAVDSANAVRAVESRDARKQFRACHGRCVQRFCLPVGALAEHNKCQDKCKEICSV